MTAKYDRDNLTFQYPENWRLEEDPPHGFPRSISVSAESGAFWCATVCGPHESLDDLTQQYLQTLENAYEDLEQQPIDVKLDSDIVSGLELQFYCLDFLVRSLLLGVHVGDHNVLLTWQAEDREFDKIEPVFRAISFSLLGP